jgi:hypothetical protein
MQRILTEQLWERIVQKFQVSHSQATRFLTELEEEEKAELVMLRAKLAAAETELVDLFHVNQAQKAEIADLRMTIAKVMLKANLEPKEAPEAEAPAAEKVEAAAEVNVQAPAAEKVQAPEAQAPEVEKSEAPAAECGALLKSGEKKGETCGKKCAPGSDRCPTHARAAVAEGEACEYVFAKGPKKDSVCGKKRCADSPFCSEHQSKPKDSKSKSAAKSEPKSEEKPAEAKSEEPKEEVKPAEAKPEEAKSEEKPEVKPEAKEEKKSPKKAPKEKSPPKEKKEKSAPKVEAKEEKPAIRAVRRGSLVVIKGTDLVIDSDGTRILGHAVLKDESWELVEEWVPVMEEAMRTYDLACALEH